MLQRVAGLARTMALGFVVVAVANLVILGGTGTILSYLLGTWKRSLGLVSSGREGPDPIILVVVVIGSVVLLIGYLYYLFYLHGADAHWDADSPLLLLAGALALSCAIPALIIFWFIVRENHLKAIRISVFMFSTGGAILWYILHREKFSSVAEKVAFFSGVCLSPVAVIDILF